MNGSPCNLVSWEFIVLLSLASSSSKLLLSFHLNWQAAALTLHFFYLILSFINLPLVSCVFLHLNYVKLNKPLHLRNNIHSRPAVTSPGTLLFGLLVLINDY